MFEIKTTFKAEQLQYLSVAFPEACKEATESKVTEALSLLERAVIMNTPKGANSLHLADQIFSKVNVSSSGEAVIGILGTPVPYGEPVEFGTKPHFPPIDPLMDWVEKVLHVSKDKSRVVAKLIAWKIYKRGTKGAYMFTKAYNENKTIVDKILDEIPDEIISRVMEG